MIRGEPTVTAGAADIGLAANGDTRVSATPGSAGPRRGQQALDSGTGPVQLPHMRMENVVRTDTYAVAGIFTTILSVEQGRDGWRLSMVS